MGFLKGSTGFFEFRIFGFFRFNRLTVKTPNLMGFEIYGGFSWLIQMNFCLQTTA